MGMVEFSQAELTFSPVEYYELVHLRRGPHSRIFFLASFFFFAAVLRCNAIVWTLLVGSCC